MIYLFNLILSVGYLYCLKKYKINFIIFFPILVLWLFILGLQYEVGTDYKTYLSIFNNAEKLKYYYMKQEYVFYYFVEFFKYIGIEGQGIFFFISFFQIYLFYLIQEKIISDKLYIFVFLYLTIGTTFYNQMNVIRLQLVVYLFTLVFFIDEYYKKILIFLLGINIHRSMLILIPIVFLEKFLLKINRKNLIYLLIIAIIISIIPPIAFIKQIALFVPRYSHYLDSKYFFQEQLKLKIVKYIYIPIYIRALLILELKNEEEKIFKIGIISLIFRIVCLATPMTNRIGDYFVILPLIPLYYYFKNFKKDKKIKRVYLIIIIFIFILKVLIVPKAEYNYKSYIFKNLTIKN